MSNNKFNGDRRIRSQSGGTPRNTQMKVGNMKPYATRLSMAALADLTLRGYANSHTSSFQQQNALMYRSRKLFFNTFYELESKI